MITVNMHEAKTRLSELVKAVEEQNETILLCRDHTPVAEIHKIKISRRSRLKGDPNLRVVFSPDYNPVEPLREDEWPSDFR